MYISVIVIAQRNNDNNIVIAQRNNDNNIVIAQRNNDIASML